MEEEVYYFAVVHFDQRTNHAQRSESKVLKRSVLRLSVEERIQVEGNVGIEE